MKSICVSMNDNLNSGQRHQSHNLKLEDQHGDSKQINIVWMGQQPGKEVISPEQIYHLLVSQQQQLQNNNLHDGDDVLSKSQPIEIQLNNLRDSEQTRTQQHIRQSLPLTETISHSRHVEWSKKDSSKISNLYSSAQLSPQQKSKIKAVFSSITTYPLKGSTHQQLKVKNQQKNITKLSKSLITHKFHNFHKPSHKSHLKTESSCFDTIEKRFYQINKQPNRNKPIKSLNFPLLSSQDQKKMTFQELFSYEKRKMHNVNGNLTQTKSDSLFKFQDHDKKMKNNDLKNYLNNHYIANNLWNKKIAYQNDKSPFTNHCKTNYLLSSTQKKHTSRNQIDQCDHGKVADSASNSQEKPIYENNRNGLSMQSKEQAYSIKKQLRTQNRKRKKLSVSLVTTYNFDYIRKETIQKSQIKQLGRKYLQQNNRKPNKQDRRSSKISIINIRGEQLSNFRKQQYPPIYQAHVENIQNSLKQPLNLIHNSNPRVQAKQIKQDLKKDNQNIVLKQIKQHLDKIHPKAIQIKQEQNKTKHKAHANQTRQKRSRFRNQHTIENEKYQQQNIQKWTSRHKFQPWQNEQFSGQTFTNDFQQITY